jgi:hypothetical protein
MLGWAAMLRSGAVDASRTQLDRSDFHERDAARTLIETARRFGLSPGVIDLRWIGASHRRRQAVMRQRRQSVDVRFGPAPRCIIAGLLPRTGVPESVLECGGSRVRRSYRG